MQIWDCTDLNSVTELLNLPSESVRQLIANDSNPNEDLLDVVVAYAGIIPGGPLEETSLTLGILLVFALRFSSICCSLNVDIV